MKPFVLLATRDDDTVADDEYAQFRAGCGLDETQLVRVRLEREALPPLEVDDYSGFIVGGSPFNASDDDTEKSRVQHRVEADMRRLLAEIVARDVPFLGACYGVGTLGTFIGATVDRTYGESVQAAPISLSAEGREDPVFGTLPSEFAAYVGHKEAVSRLPQSAVLLAFSPACPVQAFRVGRNVYATQFHPELDLAGIERRMAAYDGHGYYGEGELAATVASLRDTPVTAPAALLRAFVERHAR